MPKSQVLDAEKITIDLLVKLPEHQISCAELYHTLMGRGALIFCAEVEDIIYPLMRKGMILYDRKTATVSLVPENLGMQARGTYYFTILKRDPRAADELFLETDNETREIYSAIKLLQDKYGHNFSIK